MAPDDAELDTFDNAVEKWRDPSHGRSFTAEEWQAFFTRAGLQIEHMDFFVKRTIMMIGRCGHSFLTAKKVH